MIHDESICHLGEGPLWHPERGELFWFDILGRKLHRKGHAWSFDRIVTAAGWINEDRLLIASDRALSVFSLTSGGLDDICPLESDLPANRSNDGRADPQGGFWIGTMSTADEAAAGSIWRYYRGEIRRIVPGLSIPNSICFAPDGLTAYYADTGEKVIRSLRLDDNGWPRGESAVYVDLRDTPYLPDGSVVDADGNLWNAQWGAARVAAYDTAGREIAEIPFPALQTTCPAFGGPDLRTLYCTSAAAGQSQRQLQDYPDSGRTFLAPAPTRGLPEPRVIL